ncbi:tripartite motif-containing protein 45 isoform X3 [Patella vulgata]|uniref:tripartite motif-containing protein 45 isoform X3 n=1 Tax=Patella vulgata TaxID=6465 RepID=UPI00217FF5ED|nr:tripartite motif-containing protein 45 isoform X3 [Patella vulgata]
MADYSRYRRRIERDRYFTQGIDLSGMATTTAGSKLAQEINEEFLTCKICLEPFKSPKCLDCLHTFCEPCIDNHVLTECTYKKYSDYREFTCPLCRKRTQLPIGGVKKLPDNFLVSSLSEVVTRQKPSKFPFCDICKLVNRKHREASSKCLDCNKLLCKQCVDLHKETKVTKSHSLFDVEIEKDIECKEHSDEVVRFYCEPCEMCICVLCTFNEHKDHEITQFNEAVVKYKEAIQTLLTSCKDRIDVYDSQLELLKKCENLIKAAEQKIRDVAIQFISDIRNKEKSLIEDLHDIYGEQLMDYVSRRSDMQVNLDSLKSTCNLTEIVLKGKDIELLLLKKQVQEKLSCLSDIELEELPNSVHKEVVFNPGNLELGYLEDPDKPTKKNSPRNYRGSNLHIRSTETQTDVDPRLEKPRQCNRALQANSYDIESETTVHTFDLNVDDKNTSTDITINVDEQSYNNHRTSRHIQDDNQSENSVPEPNSSPVPRRQRRRRERPKPVEEDEKKEPVAPRVVLKQDEPKVEVQSQKAAPRVVLKKDEPKVEETREKKEPRVFVKKDEPKVEETREKKEPRVFVKKEEPKVEEELVLVEPEKPRELTEWEKRVLEKQRQIQREKEKQVQKEQEMEQTRAREKERISATEREKNARTQRIEAKRAELTKNAKQNADSDRNSKDCVVA